MEKLNKTGRIKVLAVALLFVLNLLAPARNHPGQDFRMALVAFIFCLAIIPVVVKYNAKRDKVITKPSWNDSILIMPLPMLHFFGYFFLSCGLGLLVGSGVRFHSLNYLGLTVVAAGLGIILGVLLSLKIEGCCKPADSADSNIK